MNTVMCGCGNPVESARVDLNLKRCKKCAFSNDVERPKGVMIYSGKVGGEIEIHSAEAWKEKKRYYVPSGSRSCVKNFSRNICS
jgi:hypothetical protein